VVDNASSHNLFEQITSNKARNLDSNTVRYYRNETNIGMFGNWNKCSELVNTPYLLILGDDDILDIHYIEMMSRVINKQGLNTICCSQVYRFEGEPPEFMSENSFNETKLNLKNGIDLLKSVARKGLWWPTQSTCYPTKLLLENPFRNPSIKRHSSADWYWIHSFAKSHNFCIYEEPLYKVRSHKNNAGNINNSYVTLSQAETLWDAGVTLFKAKEFNESSISFRMSAISILNSFIYDPLKCIRTINDSIHEKDPFILFVVKSWSNYSWMIRSILNNKNPVTRYILYLICRIARFTYRFNPMIFQKLAVGKFKVSELELEKKSD
jgi:hypothetical protein